MRMYVASQPCVRSGCGMGRWGMTREGKLRVDVWFLWRPMKRAWQLEQRVFKGWSPAVLATVTLFSSGPHAGHPTRRLSLQPFVLLRRAIVHVHVRDTSTAIFVIFSSIPLVTSRDIPQSSAPFYRLSTRTSVQVAKSELRESNSGVSYPSCEFAAPFRLTPICSLPVR